ncbi:YqzL family protein [Paenibacillus rigui]|uniref:YqzL family protein n=1 Tax=Paenibacillus rigui TaxID=554312 RepID=A0A229URX8_9BACL|nr:YqzL family protein [Paenibacillus rigui]OXM86100.1 YqzL family protein [Paenibacillus rigui]
MRDFSWKYFSMTGDVDAYLLYKQVSEDSSAVPMESEDDPESNGGEEGQ